MVSISSKSEIKKRVIILWNKEQLWKSKKLDRDLTKISSFLDNEYTQIPEKERVGKGSVYIAITVAEHSASFLHEQTLYEPLDLIDQIFNFPDPFETNHMTNYSLALLGEILQFSEEYLSKVLEKTMQLVEHPNWVVREMCGYPARKAYANYPEKTISVLRNWILSESANIRRVAIESLRPLRDIKWLRNPEENQDAIELLSKLKADPSVYVRKSVGNNLKDLTKYMPEKIMTLVEGWVRDSEINITDDLASKSKKELGEKNYYLIWTLKHGLRWLQARNPEYHTWLEKILGKNYVLYFNEKRNRLAKKKN